MRATNPYVHVLADPEPMGDRGQLICEKCLLEGREELEVWENFLNGFMTTDAPSIPGFYPTVVRVRDKEEERILEAREAKNKKGACVWVDQKVRGRVIRRWHLPYPRPSMHIQLYLDSEAGE